MSAVFSLRAPVKVTRGASSEFAAGNLASSFRKMAISTKAAAPAKAPVTVMPIENIHGKSGRKCMLTGKKANNGWTVSFSHIRNKKRQQVNLQYKRIYWPEKERYIRLRVSTSALKSINKLGLEEMARRAGLDLESLAYNDANPERKEWLAENGAEPVKKNKRAPRTEPKALYIPKWKEAKLAKMSEADRKAETERFAERWGMASA